MSAPLKEAGKARRHKTPRTVFALMLREMATTYGRSPGGYVWAVLEPAGAIALLSIVFSLAFRAPSLGSSFALFYATGYLPFMLFQDLSNKTAKSIQFSKPLLSYPAVTFMDAILARFLLNALTHVMVFYVVLTGVVILFDPRTIVTLPHVLNAFVMAAALGLGVGTLNCYLMAIFPVWERLWTIATRPLFILSGVLFIPEVVPRDYRDYLLWNPLIHVTGEMRRGFYPTYDAAYVAPAFVWVTALVTFALGLVLLGRYHRDILNR